VFQKKTALFGAHIAMPYCRQQHTVLVVEGYFDVLSCHEVGCRHVVASMGTALSVQQLHAAAELCGDDPDRACTIVLLLDNDPAGAVAVERVVKVVRKCQEESIKSSSARKKAIRTSDRPATTIIPTKKASIKKALWSKAVEYITQEKLCLKSGEVCSLEKASSIKDCGDICTYFHAVDACKVLNYISLTSEEVCMLVSA
jgi:5S rRNA maturation endonuclease (ribonuclease M5)